MTAVIAATGLSVRHGTVAVLRNVHLSLARHERVALLGRNGAGKTTLLHALFGLGPARGGTLRVMGHDVADWPTHRIARLGLALVPQGRGAFPTLSVQDNLRLATLHKRRRSWTLERVFHAFPALAARRATFGGALSGGERQLLAIARALLTGAEVLVLDEPSEGLAPMTAEAVIVEALGLLAAEGLTVLLAEQNVALAARLCPRAVVLAGGTVAFDGPSADLLADRALLRTLLGV